MKATLRLEYFEHERNVAHAQKSHRIYSFAKSMTLNQIIRFCKNDRVCIKNMLAISLDKPKEFSDLFQKPSVVNLKTGDLQSASFSHLDISARTGGYSNFIIPFTDSIGERFGERYIEIGLYQIYTKFIPNLYQIYTKFIPIMFKKS